MGTDNKSNHDQNDNGANGQGYNRHKAYKRESYLQETPRRQEFTRRTMREEYSTEEVCERLFVLLRWQDGVSCPRCASDNVLRLEVRRKFECRKCRYMFTVKSGTWLHGSKVPLATWLEAVFEMISDAHGMSANEISLKEGMNYDSAWRLCHIIRQAMLEDLAQSERLGGVVEVDECYTGGKVEGWGRGFKENKVLTVGMRARTGGVRFKVVGDRSRETLHGFIEDHVDQETLTAVYTDDYSAYGGIGEKLGVKHRSVNHKRKEYSRGLVHTNGIESMWATWSRQWSGVHHHISHKYAPLYFAELAWRQSHGRSTTKVLDLLKVLLSKPGCKEEGD